MFPRRKNCNGENSYLGPRIEKTQASISPNEGPGTQSSRNYYRQKTDMKYFIFVITFVKTLTMLTFKQTWFWFPHLDHTGVFDKIDDWICRFAILTRNFSNEIHFDTNDCSPENVKLVLNKLSEVSNDPQIYQEDPSIKEHCENLSKFVEDFDLPIPTTCCYQFVTNCDNHEISNALKESVHYYFCFPGIGVGQRITDHWVNIFHGSVLAHNTSVPVFCYQSDNRTEVRFGYHPLLSLFAWGGGNKPNSNRNNPRRSSPRKRPPPMDYSRYL